jgi:hypothetical protein
MEVEETTNYVILLYSHWRRSGDFSIAAGKRDILEKYLAFLAACDTTGTFLPDKGVCNTVDDGSPALQFGRDQVYLAVKVLASYVAGAELLKKLGKRETAARYRDLAGKIRNRLNRDGWKDGHFVMLLDKSAKGIKNPWTGEELNVEELPGWDSAHIYTTNGMALLDMVGLDLGIDEKRVRQDLHVATELCLREYGCVHSNFANIHLTESAAMMGLAGAARNPGWIAMNMLRDVAAFYRGVDLRYLADRYWNWQTTTNTQEPKVFFETFNGNNLSYYPRGIAVWGFFDALAGLVIDKVKGIDKAALPFDQVRVPRLFDADWRNGTCREMQGRSG